MPLHFVFHITHKKYIFALCVVMSGVVYRVLRQLLSFLTWRCGENVSKHLALSKFLKFADAWGTHTTPPWFVQTSILCSFAPNFTSVDASCHACVARNVKFKWCWNIERASLVTHSMIKAKFGMRLLTHNVRFHAKCRLHRLYCVAHEGRK